MIFSRIAKTCSYTEDGNPRGWIWGKYYVGYIMEEKNSSNHGNSSTYSIFTNGITVSAGVWLINYNFYAGTQGGYVNIQIANNSSFTSPSFIATGANYTTGYNQMYTGSYVVTAPGTTTYYIRFDSNGVNRIQENTYTWATFTRIA
jgi:hypothetical protein